MAKSIYDDTANYTTPTRNSYTTPTLQRNDTVDKMGTARPVKRQGCCLQCCLCQVSGNCEQSSGPLDEISLRVHASLCDKS